MLEVISSERKDNKKGKWLVLVCKNEKGQDRTYNVFDNDDTGKKIINESFKGPGKYDEKTVKDGQYWKLVQLDLLGQATAAHQAATQPPATHQAAAPAPATASPRQSRVDIAGTVILTVGRIFEGKGSQDTNIIDNAALTARVLMKEAADFINAGQKAPEGA